MVLSSIENLKYTQNEWIYFLIEVDYKGKLVKFNINSYTDGIMKNNVKTLSLVHENLVLNKNFQLTLDYSSEDNYFLSQSTLNGLLD